jgi:hypothetical protein
MPWLFFSVRVASRPLPARVVASRLCGLALWRALYNLWR